MNNQKTILITLILTTTILACVVPGVQTASVPPPTVDTGRLETMVAETVDAAITQTEQAHPTQTLMPTSLPTQTPTPEIILGSTLTVQEDTSTLLVDERGGYEITVPDGWLLVRLNEPEYLDAFTLPEAADSNVQASLLAIQNLDPNKYGFFAFDTEAEHIQNEFVTNLNSIWDEQSVISFENEEELKINATQLAEGTTDFEIISATLSTTSNAIPIGVVESKSTMKNTSGADVTIFQRQVIFYTLKGTVILTLSTVEELKDTVFPAFDQMIESIKLIAAPTE